MPNSEYLLDKHTDSSTVFTGHWMKVECVNMGPIVPLLLSVIVIGCILLFFLIRRRMAKQTDQRRHLVKTRKAVAISILTLIVCLLFFVLPRINKETHNTRTHTAHEALMTSLMVALNDYHRDNGVYPNSLNELKDIEYCDGATPDLIKDFKYKSDGDRYDLSFYLTQTMLKK